MKNYHRRINWKQNKWITTKKKKNQMKNKNKKMKEKKKNKRKQNSKTHKHHPGLCRKIILNT